MIRVLVRHHRDHPGPLTRWTALGVVAIVWLLGVFSASPKLHAELHADAGETDHACALTLFQQGVELPLATVPAIAAPEAQTRYRTPVAETIRPAAPRYWLPPHCGPPKG